MSLECWELEKRLAFSCLLSSTPVIISNVCGGDGTIRNVCAQLTDEMPYRNIDLRNTRNMCGTQIRYKICCVCVCWEQNATHPIHLHSIPCSIVWAINMQIHRPYEEVHCSALTVRTHHSDLVKNAKTKNEKKKLKAKSSRSFFTWLICPLAVRWWRNASWRNAIERKTQKRIAKVRGTFAFHLKVRKKKNKKRLKY